MQTVFLACLVAGAVATALLVFLGGGLHATHVHAGHVGTHGHAGGAHGHVAGAHGHAGGSHSLADRFSGAGTWALSWFSPLTLAAAALWFGAAGLLAGGGIAGLIAAVLAAIVGATILRLAMGALVRASSAPLALRAEGAIATVNATIRPDAPGEVLYTLEGLHRSLPARSTDGSVIARGTAVVITRREGGFAWVERLDPLDDSSVPLERSTP